MATESKWRGAQARVIAIQKSSDGKRLTIIFEEINKPHHRITHDYPMDELNASHPVRKLTVGDTYSVMVKK